MYTPYTSRHFTTYIDPVSQVPIAILSTHGAQIQQNLYYISNPWSADGRYFWFKCAHPSTPGHTMAVIDFLTDEVHCFFEAGANGAVDPRSGELYYGTTLGIFRRTPNPADKPVRIAVLPEVCRKASVKGAGTHLTFTPDYRELLVDIQTPLGSFIGTFDIATGAFSEWYRTQSGIPYNHAQMNPVDRDLCMCAHEYNYVPEAGRAFAPAPEDGIYPRMNVITRDGKRRVLPPVFNWAMHEWWAPDGKSVYYCSNRWRSGDHFSPPTDGDELIAIVGQNFLDGREPQIVCTVPIPGNGIGTWHAHCTQDERYFVMDSTYPDGKLTSWRGCETMLHIYDRKTDKLFKFLTKNPVVEWWTPADPCPYHIDPHPRFDLNDTLISFTTTVRGRVDVGMVAMEYLLPHLG